MKTTHRKFGEGEVLSIDENYIKVSFSGKISEFVYPDAIAKGILVVNDELFEQAKSDMAKKDKVKQEEEEKRRKEEEEKRRASEAKREKELKKVRSTYEIARENVAFKLTFCDGGADENCVGFKSFCSRENMRTNIEQGKMWCANGSLCRKFFGNEASIDDIREKWQREKLCYESNVLNVWKANAGTHLTGNRKSIPMTMRKIQRNSLAVLTTKEPNDDESKRYIFGVFIIDEIFGGSDSTSGYVKCNTEWKIELTPTEARKMLFWNYYFCPNNPEKIMFGSGLHRYLSDQQAVWILKDIAAIKQNDRDFAKRFLDEFCRRIGFDCNNISPKNGALTMQNVNIDK